MLRRLSCYVPDNLVNRILVRCLLLKIVFGIQTVRCLLWVQRLSKRSTSSTKAYERSSQILLKAWYADRKVNRAGSLRIVSS